MIICTFFNKFFRSCLTVQENVLRLIRAYKKTPARQVLAGVSLTFSYNLNVLPIITDRAPYRGRARSSGRQPRVS